MKKFVKITSLALAFTLFTALCFSACGKTPVEQVQNGGEQSGNSQENQNGNGQGNQNGNGQENQEGSGSDVETADQPLTLSYESGVYRRSFRLTVTAEAASHKIYYTLDGSAPTVASAQYADGISITENSAVRSYPLTNGVVYSSDYGSYTFRTGNACTVVRLLETDSAGREIARKTATYFISEKGEEAFTLPVVSLSLAEENALNFYNDIVNEPKERAEMEYFDFASGERFALNTQIKLGGNWTKGYPYRTMNCNFNKDESGAKNTPVTANIFQGRTARDGGVLTNFKRFRLHSGGNAQVLNWFADAFTQKVAAEVSDANGTFLNVATTGYRPAEVYLNGEYWGLYAIREHYSDVYFEQNYGVDKDDVILLDRNYNLDAENPLYNTTYMFEVAEDDEEESGMRLATELFDFLYHTDLSVWENYQRFTDMVDVQSLIDMVLVHFYAGNWDFMHNNIKMWRTANIDLSNPYADGKWRFCLHDLDFSFEFQWGDVGLYGADGYALGYNYLDFFLGNASLSYNGIGYLGNNLTCLLSSPMANEEFRALFQERAVAVKEIYSSARAQQILQAMREEVSIPMQRHCARWGRSGYGYGDWENFVDRTATVLSHRPYLYDELKFYGDGDTKMFPDGDYFERQIQAATERFLVNG